MDYSFVLFDVSTVIFRGQFHIFPLGEVLVPMGKRSSGTATDV